jgi:Protein of unknown function (DUF4240)
MFWQLVEDARDEAEGDCDGMAEALQRRLFERPVDEIVAFDKILHAMLGRANRTDLWGAAYLINGGASDDGFIYFRGWLIAQGQEVFEAALANPDSLADVAEEDSECEAMIGIDWTVYEEQTGKPAPEWIGNAQTLVGEFWKDNDELDSWLPRLAAKFS